MQPHRRAFLKDIGQGMLIASVGPALAADLFPGKARAEEAPERLTFGKLDPLVALMQENGPDKLLPLLVERMRNGADLTQLTAAAALANARAFGGEDYDAFHTMMALAPAYHMAHELPEDRRALPVFKVLVRNAGCLHGHGGAHGADTLRPVKPADLPTDKSGADAVREAVEHKDMAGAERAFAAVARAGKPIDAFNQLLPSVEEELEVHRVVLPHRAWSLSGIIGQEYAEVLLRQSVHYCVKNAFGGGGNKERTRPASRDVLPKLLDQYKLMGRAPGVKKAEDAWVDKMSRTIFASTPEQAADAVAAALAEGMAPEAIGEALSLAANQLVLRDNGRPKSNNPYKPVGSVHGDGIGVHACDSANAWRNMARYSNPANAVACLILGAYQCAFDRTDRGGDFLKWEPYPRAEAREKVKAGDAAALLAGAEAAIKNKDQATACAYIQRYGEEGHPERPVFDLLLRFAVSEDGALHAEKYYRTTSEEFAATRPAFRWRQLVGLARVTASEYGRPAPGYAEACKLLNL
jgi:hypothetical protein